MAEQDRELIFRILQESDDDDDDEIDKILLENITKKGLTGKSNKIDISKGTTHNFSNPKDVPSMSSGDASSYTTISIQLK